MSKILQTFDLPVGKETTKLIRAMKGDILKGFTFLSFFLFFFFSNLPKSVREEMTHGKDFHLLFLWGGGAVPSCFLYSSISLFILFVNVFFLSITGVSYFNFHTLWFFDVSFFPPPTSLLSVFRIFFLSFFLLFFSVFSPPSYCRRSEKFDRKVFVSLRNIWGASYVCG